MLVEKSNFTVTRMVRLLGVSRFYAWLVRVPSTRAIRAERIEAKVAWFHGDSDEVSGSPKILADLRGDGEVISRKSVAKTMRKLHLVGVCPKRWRTTTLIYVGSIRRGVRSPPPSFVVSPRTVRAPAGAPRCLPSLFGVM